MMTMQLCHSRVWVPELDSMNVLWPLHRYLYSNEGKDMLWIEGSRHYDMVGQWLIADRRMSPDACRTWHWWDWIWSCDIRLLLLSTGSYMIDCMLESASSAKDLHIPRNTYSDAGHILRPTPKTHICLSIMDNRSESALIQRDGSNLVGSGKIDGSRWR